MKWHKRILEQPGAFRLPVWCRTYRPEGEVEEDPEVDFGAWERPLGVFVNGFMTVGIVRQKDVDSRCIAWPSHLRSAADPRRFRYIAAVWPDNVTQSCSLKSQLGEILRKELFEDARK